jgi:hypothetical protein
MAMSTASETRLLAPPVTFTTGMQPRRPQVRPFGDLKPGLIRPRSKPRRPGPPPSFYDGPGLLLPGGDGHLVALGGLAGGNLHAPPGLVQQQVSPAKV